MKATPDLRSIFKETSMAGFFKTFLELSHTDALKPLLPAIFFFAGVTYDSLTLTRIDRLFDNLVLLIYLSLLGVLIIINGRLQLGLVPIAPSESTFNAVALIHRARPHFEKVMQFFLGGLFSAYAILYSQSASLSTTAIFLGFIVLFLTANEFLRDRYSSLKLMITLFAFVTFSFLTFFLPVLTGWMNWGIFLLGVGLSALVVWKVARLILHGISGLTFKAPVYLCLPAFTLIAVCTLLYFVNWIPPIPLSLKFGGLYQHIEKTGDAYHLTFEEGPWYALWKRSDDLVGTNQQVFAFSAVFAPVSLNTTIFHHWQWRSLSTDSFTTTDRIPISISGGREKGYRMYTMKQQLLPGEWRVDVETEDGRLIGRMEVLAEAEFTPSHSMKTLER